ncbi:HAD-superfamily hydrolase, subfamily IIB [Thalassoporum mexicanum PCC 7367]|uniref:HAD family hydrolase n=1 Tax=Thalassoporum mexicanum TaxID=3457544 RepID=UPI00029F8403|nr:HAD-IIB family hydrolase [Pseudanabaena sp. PCC 7367]AFY70159.1 HAD-superfamily hydrolase, subfamily IIB [Pseudanabaena sp. PCC 7367]
MAYLAIASDFDGTIAIKGQVADSTRQAIAQWREAGGKFLIVTGRLFDQGFDHLTGTFPQIWDYCDGVVAENGALVYLRDRDQKILLGAAPPPEFMQALAARGVDYLFHGEVIVATREPYLKTTQTLITEMTIDAQIILNKGEVMILPQGVNKAAGLSLLLKELQIAPEQVVAVGDAENDYDLINLCGYGVAVANALPQLREIADLVTIGICGEGVVELIDRLLA